MTDFKQLDLKLRETKKAYQDFLDETANDYGDIFSEESEEIEDYRLFRNKEYFEGIIALQENLLGALKLIEQGNNKDIHNANKNLEVCVSKARKFRKLLTQDIETASDTIEKINNLISICDEHRK